MPLPAPPPMLTTVLTRRLPDSVLFLLGGLTFIAAVLYLPHHVAILVGRAWYYIKGDDIDLAASAREAVKEMSASILPDALRTRPPTFLPDKEL